MFFAARERELALRRAALHSRSAALRGRVAEHAAALQRPLWLADAAWRAWRWLRAHPEAIAAGVVVVVVLRPGRVFTLARWAWKGWRAWQALRRWTAPAQA